MSFSLSNQTTFLENSGGTWHSLSEAGEKSHFVVLLCHEGNKDFSSLASDQSRGNHHSHTSHPSGYILFKHRPLPFRAKELKRDGEDHDGAVFGSHGGPGDEARSTSVLLA